MSSIPHIRLGTRRSPLAMAQAEETRARLCAAHGWAEEMVELVPVLASGDKVLDRPLADKLFGADRAVGQSVRLGKYSYRVVGVIDRWRPTPHFYDLDSGGAFDPSESIYLPLGCVHRLANPGKILLEVIEVQTGSYLGEDDIIRIEDEFGRA